MNAQNNFDTMIHRLLEAAKEANIEKAEAYISSDDSFRAGSVMGEINQYAVKTTKGISFRGIYKNKMGYSATELLDEAGITQLINGVIESANLSEEDEPSDIFAGESQYPSVKTYFIELEKVTEEEKLGALTQMEKSALDQDERIAQATNMIITAKNEVRIVNSFGLDIAYESNYCAAYTQTLAKDGEGESQKTASSFELGASHDFKALNTNNIAKKSAEGAIYALNAKAIPSGSYPAIIYKTAMADLLETFSGAFSAENAQHGLSLLAGKVGEDIAAPCVTLMDDPLLADGLGSRPFDDEGVASKTKAVIAAGRLETLLHNRKTAKKDGVESTGNASKASYASPVKVAPTNFFIKSGFVSFDDMLNKLKEGIVITELEGLHSGANGISGDFSLSAKGYAIKDGKKGEPINQITIAGNFFELLKSITDIADDLHFPFGGVGSPSVRIAQISVAGL